MIFVTHKACVGPDDPLSAHLHIVCVREATLVRPHPLAYLTDRVKEGFEGFADAGHGVDFATEVGVGHQAAMQARYPF